MTTKVIIGVDDSDTALEAAFKAASLAQSLDGELYVLSAYGMSETKRFNDGVDNVVVNLADVAKKTASDVAEKLQEQYSSLTVKPSAAAGRPADALVAAAEDLEVDLIVVGNKRVQGISRFLGSIASSVAAEAPCDLYVVNTHTR